jgi:hypothetical protein
VKARHKRARRQARLARHGWPHRSSSWVRQEKRDEAGSDYDPAQDDDFCRLCTGDGIGHLTDEELARYVNSSPVHLPARMDS